MVQESQHPPSHTQTSSLKKYETIHKNVLKVKGHEPRGYPHPYLPCKLSKNLPAFCAENVVLMLYQNAVLYAKNNRIRSSARVD